MHATDLDLSPRQVLDLTSADALASFLDKLGYDTGARTALTPESIGLAGTTIGIVCAGLGLACRPLAHSAPASANEPDALAEWVDVGGIALGGRN